MTTTHTPAPAQPVTPRPRIRWETAPGDKSLLGYVGTLSPWVFQIWTGGDGKRWQLLVQLPGMEDMRPTAGYPAELQDEAENLLAGFAASLGAVFAADLPLIAAGLDRAADDCASQAGTNCRECAGSAQRYCGGCQDLLDTAAGYRELRDELIGACRG